MKPLTESEDCLSHLIEQNRPKMPPKGKDGLKQSASAAGKPFNEDAKTELLTEMITTYDEIKYPRCGDFSHGHILYCNEKFKKGHWSKGDGNFADKQAVDVWFQAERDRLITEGKFTPKIAPKSSLRSTTSPRLFFAKAPPTIPGNNSAGSSSSNPPAIPVKKKDTYRNQRCRQTHLRERQYSTREQPNRRT